MKIKNKFKFIRGIILIIFILSIIFCKTTFSYKEVEYKTLYISEGDTLWSIAEELSETNNYYKSKDVREIIYNIESINKLSSSTLYVNQELLIPYIWNFYWYMIKYICYFVKKEGLLKWKEAISGF